MRRRQFLATLGAAATWPLVARAQPTAPARIGLLLLNTAEEEKRQGVDEAFRTGLTDVGYVVGETAQIETRFGEGHLDRLPGLVAELVAARVDVIVSAGEGFYAAARTTHTTPVVAATVSGDLVAQGFAESLAHPGGNVTGSFIFGPEVLAKRFEALRQIVPGLKRAGVFLLRGYPTNPLFLEGVATVAKVAGVELFPYEVYDVASYEAALDSARQSAVGGVVIAESAQFYGDGKIIAALAAARALPTVGPPRTARDGVLIGYGVDHLALVRRAAVFVDKILKGAKPGDIPIERASHFLTIVNLKTAASLGVEIPQTLLAAAAEVIE
jgi:putative tryptophan/tyrosine transport system substrate-binding protein